MTHVMSDANLRANIAARDGHELVVELPHATGAASHDAHVADILSHGPITIVVDEVGVEPLLLHRVLERAVVALDLAEAQHVGLAHEDVHLHGLTHVRRLAIGVRQLVLPGARGPPPVEIRPQGTNRPRIVQGVFLRRIGTYVVQLRGP